MKTSEAAFWGESTLSGHLLSLECGFKGFLSFVGAAVPGSGVMLLFGLGAMAVP